MSVEKGRWITYWYQINEVVNLTQGNDVLEIGIGDRTVSNYLRERGYNVTTLDINPSFHPDFVGDVTKLPFKSNVFDVVLCAQVLEHLPFHYFEESLSELVRVSNDGVVISLPNPSLCMRVAIRLPFIREKTYSIKYGIPLFWRERDNKPYEIHGRHRHYFEVGEKEYSLKRIIGIMEEYCRVLRYYQPDEVPQKRFFVLKREV